MTTQNQGPRVEDQPDPQLLVPDFTLGFGWLVQNQGPTVEDHRDPEVLVPDFALGFGASLVTSLVASLATFTDQPDPQLLVPDFALGFRATWGYLLLAWAVAAVAAPPNHRTSRSRVQNQGPRVEDQPNPKLLVPDFALGFGWLVQKQGAKSC